MPPLPSVPGASDMQGGTVAMGAGSGVALVWLWNSVAPWAFSVPLEGAGAWPAMTAEVAAVLAPALMALIQRLVDGP